MSKTIKFPLRDHLIQGDRGYYFFDKPSVRLADLAEPLKEPEYIEINLGEVIFAPNERRRLGAMQTQNKDRLPEKTFLETQSTGGSRYLWERHRQVYKNIGLEEWRIILDACDAGSFSESFRFDRMDCESLYRFLNRMDESIQTKLDRCLTEIEVLANKEGIRAIGEAECLTGFDDSFGLFANDYQRVTALLRTNRETFEQALVFCELNGKSRLKSRTDLPKMRAGITDTTLCIFAERIKMFYKEYNGGGRLVTSCSFDLSMGIQVVRVFIESAPQRFRSFDKSFNLNESWQTVVFEVDFFYDPKQGELSLAGSVIPTVKTGLEEIYIRTFLGIEPPPVVKPVFNLDIFKHNLKTLPTEPEDGIEVKVGDVRVHTNDNSYVYGFGATGQEDAYAALTRIDETARLLNEGDVILATISIKFKRRPGIRARSVTITFTPDFCRFQTESVECRKIIQKYQKKWGIITC